MRFSFSRVWIFHQNFQFLTVLPLLVLARPSAFLCFRNHHHTAHCWRFFCLSLWCRVWWGRFEVSFSLLSKNKSLKTLSFGALNFESLHIYRQGKSEIWARLYDSRIWNFFWNFIQVCVSWIFGVSGSFLISDFISDGVAHHWASSWPYSQQKKSLPAWPSNYNWGRIIAVFSAWSQLWHLWFFQVDGNTLPVVIYTLGSLSLLESRFMTVRELQSLVYISKVRADSSFLAS